MILYHATYGCYLDSIMTYGLTVGNKPNWFDDGPLAIWLSDDPEFGRSFCESSDANHVTDEMVDDIVVLIVDCNGLTLEPDPYYDETNAVDGVMSYIHIGNISPDRITILEQ